MENHEVRRAAADVDRRGSSSFWSFTPLSRVGRILVVSAVAVVVGLEFVLAIFGLSQEPTTATVAQLALTVCFALFAWRPPTAAFVLMVGAMMLVSLSSGDEPLLAAAIAAGLVVATCSIRLAVVYGIGFLGLLVLAVAAGHRANPLPVVVAFTLFAAVAVIIGSVVRAMGRRAAILAEELVERERQLEEVVRAERERLADELHDFIAHELTIIAMHASVLEQVDDPQIQAESREAIATSARQALADIRRVLEVTHAGRLAAEETDESVVERRRLVPTVTDVERELAAAGFTVDSRGVFEVATRMSRTMEVALAQFVRESATNVVKHAPPGGRVELRLTLEGEHVVLRMSNPLGAQNRGLGLPTGGYGLARMNERAAVLGGTFRAGVDEGSWRVEVRLPAL